MRRTLVSSGAACLAVLAAGGCSPVVAPVQPELPGEYVAQFNEPFLTFTSTDGSLTLTAPDDPGGTRIPVSRTITQDSVQFDGAIDPAAPDSRFRLTIRREDCQDDMAGLYFSHSARLERGERLELRPHSGCARLTSEPQPRE